MQRLSSGRIVHGDTLVWRQGQVRVLSTPFRHNSPSLRHFLDTFRDHVLLLRVADGRSNVKNEGEQRRTDDDHRYSDCFSRYAGARGAAERALPAEAGSAHVTQS